MCFRGASPRDKSIRKVKLCKCIINILRVGNGIKCLSLLNIPTVLLILIATVSI